MFAQRFFGGRFFGARYWADKGGVAIAAVQPTGGKWSQDPYRRFKAPEEQDAEPTPVEIMSGVVDRGRHVVIIPGRPMAFDTDESMRLLRRVRRSRANAEREAEDDDAMLLLF